MELKNIEKYETKDFHRVIDFRRNMIFNNWQQIIRNTCLSKNIYTILKDVFLISIFRKAYSQLVNYKLRQNRGSSRMV